jgi:hypothetical protein
MTALALPSVASASNDAIDRGTMPAVLTSITINPVNPSVVSGQTEQFTAQGLDQDGNVMTVTDAIVAMSDNVTGSVSETATSANLSITTVSLADGQVDVDYSQTLVATNGTPPYTWEISTGSLPDGLYLTEDIISGTPTAAGIFSFTVVVTDSTSPIPNTFTENLSITISPAAPTTAFIVRLVSGLSTAAQQQVIARNGGVETSSVPVLKMHFIKVPNATIDEVLQRYQSDPNVRSIEYDTQCKIGETPSDPSYPDQWALPRIAWDSVFGSVYPTGSSVIAILDTGIDASHPDLSGLVLPGYSAFEGSDAQTDPNGHGTKMAGITAALTDNDIGVAGVAYAGVSLLSIQVLGADGTGQDSDVIYGIVWAVDYGANVILMAFSNPDYSPALQEAIDYAWDNGVILVAAAGNDGLNTVTYPAGDRGVIGVSATDPNDALFPSSNYGLLIFLAAPGVNLLTTDLDGGYTTVSGTSAAAAMIAGAAAFMHAVDPGLSNGVIVGRLARSADPAGTQEQTGNGRLNMSRALNDTGTDPVQPAGASPLGDGGPYVGPYTAAAIRTSTAAGGVWATGSTWVGGVAPLSTDTVIIATTGGDNVTLGASATCAGLTVNSGAILEFNAGTYGLTVNGNVVNYGTITVTNHSNFNSHVLSFTGDFTCPGEFDGGSKLDDVLNLTISGTGTQSISGFTITYLPGYTENSTIQTITMSKTGGTATLTGDIVGGHALVINGSGGTLNLGTDLTHTFSGTWTRTNGILNGGSSTLRIGGSVSGTGGTFTANTGTVEWYAAGAQTCAVVTYNNLTLSGSGVKTFATTPTVNGILSMEGTATVTVTTGVVTYGGSATLQYNTATARTVSAEEWITPFAATGGVIITNTGTITLNAAKVFNASIPLTIDSGATLATANYQLTFGGDFVNDGGTFNAGSSVIVIANTMTNQSIAGFTTTGDVSLTKTGGTATFDGNVNGGSLIINGSGGTLDLSAGLTHTFTGTWTRTNGILNGGSSTLRIGGSVSGTGGTFTANTGTVEWYAAGAQTCAVVTYNNLTLSGSGVKTFATTPTVNGILSMEGTATVTVTTGVVTYGGSATLQYNTATARTVSAEEWITPFAATGGVIITNTGTITLNAAKVFNASIPLTIDSGATLATANYQLTFGGDFVNDGGTFNAGSSVIVIANTMTNQSIAGFTTTGDVSLTKTGGTATFDGNVNGGSLIINGSGGTLDLSAGLTHTFTGTWTRTNGILNGGSSTLRIGGSVSGTGGTFTANTGTVEWYAAGAQTVAAVTYNNLTLSGSGAKTMTGVTTIGGDLTISGSATMTGNAGFTVTGLLNYGSSGTTTLTASTPISIGTFNQTAGTLVDNGNTITVTGSGADTWAKSGGSFTATGTVTFTGTTPQIGAFTFNNLSINVGGSNTATLTGDITVSSTLTLTSGTLTVEDNTLTLNGPTIAGTPTNLDTDSASSLSFGGSSAGVNIPSSVTVLNNLTINNSQGITLNSNLTIGGTLTFTSGNLLAGSNTAIITAGGTVSRTSGHVIGNLVKYVALGATSGTFEVGTASAYNPVTVVFGSVTTAGNLMVKVTPGQHPNIGTSIINWTKDVNEYWSLTNSGIVFDSCNVTFTFVPGDILGGANPNNFIVGQYNSVWIYPDVGTKTATSTQAIGITSFSDFCLGEMIIPPTVNSVTLVDNSLTPQVEYTVNVNVSNADNMSILDTLVLKLWYDSSGSDYSESTFDGMTADTQYCAIITWTQSTGSFVIEPSSSTTWALGICSAPGSFLGDFVFRFTVGKVATAADGSARWQVAAKISNTVGQTGYNHDSTPPTMNWYGEITINTVSVTWMSMILLGSGFTDDTTNRVTDISITYICNGNYNMRVKASSPWSGSGNSITLSNDDTPGDGEFALKADDDDTLDDAVLVLSTGYTTFSTGTQTGEDGNIVTDNSLWLKLGASGIPNVQYSGTIYYEITPG